MSFSKMVKDEYCSLNWEDICCVQAEVMGCLLCSGKFRQGQIAISTSNENFAKRIDTMIRELYAAETYIKKGREIYNILVTDKIAYAEIIADLNEHAGFDAIRGTVVKNVFTQECCRKAFLRGLFLAGGSISEPNKSYHMEILTRRQSVAKAAVNILEKEEINANTIRKSGYYLIYLKESQQISDFLLITGAHNAMLDFESLRVDKSVRNSVNRVVNCDNANSVKIAYTGARQHEAALFIKTKIGLDKLPDDLKEAAILRIENSDLSLKELGELMTPPLGKSGMNHRLKKIEKIAQEYMSK
jgi:DNA-binding protein WhiA